MGEPEIIHYGVLGQRWGVRRTPEELGHFKKFKGYEYDPSRPARTVGESVASAAALSTVLIPGVNIATILAASAVQKRLTNIQRDQTNYDPQPIRPINSLPKKKKETTEDEDIRACNRTMTKGHVNNCVSCVLSYDMRRRGYDVSAAPTNKGANSYDVIRSNYKGEISTVDYKMKPGTSYESLYKDITNEAVKKFPSGSRGALRMWFTSGGGHVLSWERDDDSITFSDPQSGNTKWFNYNFSHTTGDYQLVRMDNLTPKDSITERLLDGSRKK